MEDHEIMTEQRWANVGGVEIFGQRDRALVKVDGQQIALFDGPKGLYACANRCPHEGFPLVEGKFSAGCKLVCNWHGWAFDLSDGETSNGGEAVRTYPVERRGDEIWLDVSDPPADVLQAQAEEQISGAMEDLDYERIARGLARLTAAGGNFADALPAAIHWAAERFEYGATHAWAATADWITLAETQELSGCDAIIPWLEALHHIAWDGKLGKHTPFSTEVLGWSADAFIQAIDDQNEGVALAILNGALEASVGWQDLREPFTRAALMHYSGFGHSIIYVTKIDQLIRRLGDGVMAPLALSMVRSLVNARRDDLIPEFKAYAPALAEWRDGAGAGDAIPVASDFVGLNPARALKLALASGADHRALFDALLAASALTMLKFEETRVAGIEQPISQNIGWLDFSHALTFANALRRTGRDYPDLMPAGLLQMACFIGRNAGFIDAALDPDEWRVADRQGFEAECIARILDHGEVDPIFSCHYLKTFIAMKEEAAETPNGETAELIYAVLNRFFHGLIKRRHVRRAAHQAMELVSREG